MDALLIYLFFLIKIFYATRCKKLLHRLTFICIFKTFSPHVNFNLPKLDSSDYIISNIIYQYIILYLYTIHIAKLYLIYPPILFLSSLSLPFYFFIFTFLFLDKIQLFSLRFYY